MNDQLAVGTSDLAIGFADQTPFSAENSHYISVNLVSEDFEIAENYSFRIVHG